MPTPAPVQPKGENPTSDSDEKGSSDFGTILGLVLLFASLVGALTLFVYYRRRRQAKDKENQNLGRDSVTKGVGERKTASSMDQTISPSESYREWTEKASILEHLELGQDDVADIPMLEESIITSCVLFPLRTSEKDDDDMSVYSPPAWYKEMSLSSP